MPDDLNPLEMAEGLDKLQEVISRGLAPAERRSRNADKSKWQPMNIRMDPGVKRRLRALKKDLQVPIEELVHVALVQFLEAYDAGEPLEVKTVAVRKTVL